jgi:hypothetical protein
MGGPEGNGVSASCSFYYNCHINELGSISLLGRRASAGQTVLQDPYTMIAEAASLSNPQARKLGTSTIGEPMI